MASRWSRKNIFKQFGITIGTNETGEPLILPDNPLNKRLAKPVTAITLGAGARGNVYGDYAIEYSKTYKTHTTDVDHYKNEGHVGGDWRLVSDWIQAVAQHNPNLLTSTIEAAIESHIMSFAVV